MSITKEEAIKYLEKLGFTITSFAITSGKKNEYHLIYQNMDCIGETLKEMMNTAYYKAQACLELTGIKYTRWRTDGVIGCIDVVF